jgi:hypothetical protein
VHPEWAISFGPGTRYDYNFNNQVHTMEFYGTAGVRYARGVGLDVRAGYLTEKGGNEAERLPGTPFMGVNLTLTPADWFKTVSDRKITDTVPKRKKASEGQQ